MPKIRVADYIASFLEAKGIKKVFLLPGGGMMHLLDAISRKEKVETICHHHEQSCAIAAEGYARKTGSLGVCYATSGPGATNTITGILGAWQDSSPLLIITGQAKLSQTIRQSQIPHLRQYGTFEADIVPMVESITKYAVFLNDPATIRHHLEKSYHIALEGRPGPVLIDIPVDIQGALINPEELEGYTPLNQTVEPPSELQISQIVERFLKGKKPLILAGHGVRVAGQAERFETLINRLNVPVATTQLAKDLLPYDHPLFVGHPGMKGDRAGNFAVQEADFILTVGCSLHVLTTGYELDRFAPNAYKIQVDLDRSLLLRQQVGINEQIISDLETFFAHLNERAAPAGNNSLDWRNKCAGWKRDLAVKSEPHVRINGEINLYDFIERLSASCNGTETIITDAGSAYYAMGQAFRLKKGQRFLVSGALGAMGFALPAATGTSFADRTHPVLCVTGDGSLQTNIHELSVFSHHHLNIKLFVLNNNGYISIKTTQANFFNGYFVGVNKETGISFPNLEKIAEAYQIPYRAIKTETELAAADFDFIHRPGPMIIEVFATEQQTIIPTVTSEKLPDGKMISRPLDDMFPYMSRERREKLLIE